MVKFQNKRTENDITERNAQAKKDELEKELTPHQTRLTQLAPITFVNYIRQAIASQGITSGIFIAVLIFTQLCMVASATVGSLGVLVRRDHILGVSITTADRSSI